MRYETTRIRADFGRSLTGRAMNEAGFPLLSVFHILSRRLKRRGSLFSAYRPEKHYMRGPSGKV